MWKIRSKTQTDLNGRPRYWSDDVGWTWKDFATVYGDKEHDNASFPLPMNGVWEQQDA